MAINKIEKRHILYIAEDVVFSMEGEVLYWCGGERESIDMVK